ncbi:MAG TPA: winged helix-turn-helix domain-containing protein, partial [Beijerinckiaceae bacterium]
VKPIDFRELVLRMRRARPARAAADAPTAPDPGAMALTQAEHRLARLFADAGGRVLTRDDIARRALHRSDAGAGRAVDNLVSRLRRKFNRLEPPRVIWSVRGEGYRLAARSEPPRGPTA